jgi:hypothetical protein
MRTFSAILLLAAFALGQDQPPAPVSPGSPSTTVHSESAGPEKAVVTDPSKSSSMDPTTLRVIKHVALVLSTLGLLLLIGWLAVKQADGRAKTWTHDFLLDPTDDLTFPADSRIPPDHRTRLKNQLVEVGDRIKHHTGVTAYFYAAYYMSIMVFSVSAALAAIALLLVSKGGWESSNEYVITIFFTTAVTSAFFGSSPAVFEQQQNISDNKVFAMKYLALKNEIFTYAVTGEALNYDIANPLPVVPGAVDPLQKAPMGITSSPTEFLHYVDLQLSRDNVAIGFDVKQVANYKGALEMK